LKFREPSVTPMPNDQLLMGVAVALMSVIAVWKADWLLQNTRKGQRLLQRFGERNARRTVIALFLATALLGVLLATDLIRPLQW